MIVRWGQLVVYIQVKKNKQSSMKEKSLWLTDGKTNYIAVWKLTLETDGNACYSSKYSILTDMNLGRKKTLTEQPQYVVLLSFLPALQWSVPYSHSLMPLCVPVTRL